MFGRAETSEVERYLPLVRRIAARYCGAGLPFEDLVQEGSLGLLDALDRYDPERGADFDAYASFRIRRAIFNALTESGRLVRLPKHVVERRHVIDRETERFFAATGRAPTDEELAERTSLSAASIAEARRAAITPISLDQPVLADGSPLEQFVADPRASDPEQLVLLHDEERRVDEAVAHLSNRERFVVEHAFGFETPPESIAAVAQELHLSTPRTRAIALAALAKLRGELERVSVLALIGPFFS